MEERIYPAEAVYAEQVEAAAAEGKQWERAPVTAELKAEALKPRPVEPVPDREVPPRAVGQFRPGPACPTRPLTKRASTRRWPRSPAGAPRWRPEALNCGRPPTHRATMGGCLADVRHGRCSRSSGLPPAARGPGSGSAFCMTEPEGGPPATPPTSPPPITPDGDGYVIKRAASGGRAARMSSDCKVFIVMGRLRRSRGRGTQPQPSLPDPGAPGHAGHHGQARP